MCVMSPAVYLLCRRVHKTAGSYALWTSVSEVVGRKTNFPYDEWSSLWAGFCTMTEGNVRSFHHRGGLNPRVIFAIFDRISHFVISENFGWNVHFIFSIFHRFYPLILLLLIQKEAHRRWTAESLLRDRQQRHFESTGSHKPDDKFHKGVFLVRIDR